MRTISDISIIDGRTLANWIRSGAHYQVVDVRDYDYTPEHIPGAWHIPYEALDEQELVARLRELAKLHKSVYPLNAVFHCTMSQQRGPSAAMRTLRALDDQDLATIRVCVLRGGFQQWLYDYGADEGLTSRGPESTSI